MGKIVAFIGALSRMDFQKDVILTPSYLAKWLKTSCDLYYGVSTSSDILCSFRNVNLHCMNAKENSREYVFSLLKMILRNSREIECMITFHVNTVNICLTLFLKLLNPKAKVWILGDLNLDNAERLVKHNFVFSSGLLGLAKSILINCFFSKLDIYSLETRKYFEMFKPLFMKKGWRCLTYFPCGWDEDNQYSTVECSNKENIILSCARFGTYQKNTEMLLEGVAKLDLKDWKVYLVGPITSGFDLSNNQAFNEYLDAYFTKYPQLRNKVIFTGPIFDTKELFGYFQKAKVFVMTSRFEGFANVFSQARWNQCYIVSTDVGGACDMSNSWQYGIKVADNDSDDLSSALSYYIDNENDIPEIPRAFSEMISYNYIIPKYILNKN